MNVNITRTILFCGSAMYIAVPAIAQDRNPVVAQSSQTESKLEEIVVTARRREESLQNVPVSVSAFSAEALERATVQELRSINVLTPGLTFSNEGGGGNATLSLRGIGQIPLGEGTPGVVIYVNNMALPPDGSNIPTYDIGSIQVLKGPQGTLFGKNTLGGAVLVNSKAPDYTMGGYVQGTYGRYDYQDFEGAINIPIVEDRVALSRRWSNPPAGSAHACIRWGARIRRYRSRGRARLAAAGAHRQFEEHDDRGILQAGSAFRRYLPDAAELPVRRYFWSAARADSRRAGRAPSRQPGCPPAQLL